MVHFCGMFCPVRRTISVKSGRGGWRREGRAGRGGWRREGRGRRSGYSRGMPEVERARRERLQPALAALGADAALITSPANVRYLTGLASSNAALLLPAARSGGQSAARSGSQSAGRSGDQSAASPGGQPAAPSGQPAAPPTSPPAPAPARFSRRTPGTRARPRRPAPTSRSSSNAPSSPRWPALRPASGCEGSRSRPTR